MDNIVVPCFFDSQCTVDFRRRDISILTTRQCIHKMAVT